MLMLCVLLLLCLCLTWSIWLRQRRFREVMQNVEMKVSPVSLAVQELVATAGGVYLSLIMLVSFLKLAIPEKVLLFEVSLDPLACTSICLAVVQPLFYKVFTKTK